MVTQQVMEWSMRNLMTVEARDHMQNIKKMDHNTRKEEVE